MTSSRIALGIALPALFAALAFAPSARADVFPPNVCDQGIDDPSVAGMPCTLDDGGGAAGVCTLSSCGGTAPQPCYVCEVPDGGADAATDAGRDSGEAVDSGETADSGAAVDSGETLDSGKAADSGPGSGQPDSGPELGDSGIPIASPTTSGGGGGCAVAAPGSDEAVGGVMFGFGLMAYAFSRRKKQR